jgi:N-methylhydantoinase B
MAIAAGDERTNEGYFRPIHLKTTPGTQFHAERPAPCANAFAPLLTLINRIQEALGRAAPERMPAGFGQNVSVVMFGSDAAGQFWADSINMVGGAPASAVYGDAGGPLFDFGCSGLRLVSWEVWEAKTPMLVQRCEYVPDTAGTGKYRGGAGVDLVVEALLDMSITIVSEREKSPPHALAGGVPGRPTAVWLHTPAGSERHQKGTHLMPQGSTVDLRFSGGGSYGPPQERDPEAVLADIAAGLLTEEGARSAYPHAMAGR